MVLTACVLAGDSANLFAALIVDGFCLSEEEKLIKQEKNHIEAMAEESAIVRAMGVSFDDPMALIGGAMDTFKAFNEEGLGMVKELPKPRHVMKAMSSAAASKTLSGPLARAKKEMGRAGNLADKASGGQMGRLKDEAEKRVSQAKDELEKQAAKAVEAAKEAAEEAKSRALEAAEEAKKRAEEALDEVQKHAEEKMAEMQAKIDEGIDDGLTPKQRRKQASWHIFALKHPARKACIDLADHPKFEPTVLVLIGISSISIAAEGAPGTVHRPFEQFVYHFINVTILIVFVLEFAIKTIAEGFLQTPSAYLKGSWNRLDFVILISSVAEFAAATLGEGDSIRVLRVLRILRPLRLIKSNESMQALIDALRNVLPIMVGVLGLMLIFFTSYAIFGLGLFMGKFYFCNCEGKWGLPATNCTHPDPASLGRDQCLAQGGSWDNPPYNFDNFFQVRVNHRFD
eukprot:COSAG02_NODE_1617_length_11651_cov_10.500519_1_plen_457_part_00